MYVENEAKRKKEVSMNLKLRQTFEEDLDSIKSAFSKKAEPNLLLKYGNASAGQNKSTTGFLQGAN